MACDDENCGAPDCLEDRLAEMERERDDALLRAERAEELMTVMAARLDALERKPEPPPSVGIVGAAWRGPARNYWENSGEINRQLAQGLQESLRNAAQRQNPPDLTHLNPGALHAQAIEANSTTVSPEGGEAEEVPGDGRPPGDPS